MKPRYFSYNWLKLNWPIYTTIRMHKSIPIKVMEWEEHKLGSWRKADQAKILGPRLIIAFRSLLLKEINEDIAIFDAQTTPEKLKDFLLSAYKKDPWFKGEETVLDLIVYYNPDADMSAPHLKMSEDCVECNNDACGGRLEREPLGEECLDQFEEENHLEEKKNANPKVEKT